MKNETSGQNAKALRKASIQAAKERDAFEATAFGRRRIHRNSKLLTVLSWAKWIITMPCVYVYRRLRHRAVA
jgi:hypothetical protein